MGKHFKLSLSTIIFIFTIDLNGDEQTILLLVPGFLNL